jgi:hypothetical protein
MKPHTRDKLAATHAHKTRERSIKTAQRSYSSTQVPNLNQRKQRHEFDVSALLDVQWVLGVMLHAHRGPFYSPKAARSRLSSIWKALVAFCSWAHRTEQCVIPFLFWQSRPLQLLTLVAHRTVRCDLLTVGWATCHPLIARSTVARGAAGTPDSLVHTRQSGKL